MNEYRDDAAKETPVRGFLHQPAEANGDSLILTHGAGANCNAPVLVTTRRGVLRLRSYCPSLRSALPPNTAQRTASPRQR